jgi:hypothetical protein
MKRKPGRPSVYREDVAERILTQIAAGKSLPTICRAPGMPKVETIGTWIWRNHEGFADRYFHAFCARCSVMAQEAVDIVDEAVGGDMAAQSCAKNRADMRKWLLSRLIPDRFGDRLALAGGASASPIVHLYLPERPSRLIEGHATTVVHSDESAES